MMPWFRMFSEARNDRKLASLSDAQFRVWFNLLCLASESKERGVVTAKSPEILAIEVSSGDVTLLLSTVSTLRDLGIVETELSGDNAYVASFVNWKSRQYDKPSATPERVSERVSKHRETKRNAEATPVKRDVTPSNTTDTDTDTDTEENQTRELPPTPPKGKSDDDFEEFWKSYPSGNGSKSKSFEQWKKVRGQHRAIMSGLDAWKQSERWNKGYVKTCELWLRDRLWENPPPPQQQGSVLDGTKPAFVNGRQNYTEDEGKEYLRRHGWITEQ